MSSKPLAYGITPPQELLALAASMRRVIENMMVIDTSHDDLEQARATLDEIAQRLEGLGRRGKKARMQAHVEPGPEDLRPYFAGNARHWHYNPIFPPTQVERTESGLRAKLTLGLPHEGPPGCAHGGIVALLLDQILGQANFEHGVPAMTGTLTIRYRRPTPLFEELTIEADGPESADGKKCLSRGRILCHGKVTAEAQGLFVLPEGIELPLMHREG